MGSVTYKAPFDMLPDYHEKAAMTEANAPSAVNPFATEADIAGAGLAGVGSIASASLAVRINNFTDGDTVMIGADVYEAKTGAPAGNEKKFDKGATIDEALDNLAVRINNPLVGTENVLAYGPTVVGSGAMYILAADAPGGNPVPGFIPTPMLLTVTYSSAGGTADWDHSDLDATGAQLATKFSAGSVSLSIAEAARLVLGEFVVLGFAPIDIADTHSLTFLVVRSDGRQRLDVTDEVGIWAFGALALVGLAGSGSTHVLSGETVYWNVAG